MTVSNDAVEQGAPAAELTFTSGVWWRQRENFRLEASYLN